MLIYTPGVWDLLHIGHIRFLKRAKKIGSHLIVGVASDPVVEEDKGKRPIIQLDHRIEMLQSLNCVDSAVPYYELEFMTHINIFEPDIFVCGQYWGNLDRHRAVEDSGIKMLKLPYTDETSTSVIKNRVIKETKIQ